MAVGKEAHVGHTPPTNVTTVAFFLQEAPKAANLCNRPKKLPKCPCLVARECHEPSQGWRVWRLNDTSCVSNGRSTPWCWFREEVHKSRRKHHLRCDASGLTQRWHHLGFKGWRFGVVSSLAFSMATVVGRRRTVPRQGRV